MSKNKLDSLGVYTWFYVYKTKASVYICNMCCKQWYVNNSKKYILVGIWVY